jgi:hypothetical protein
MRHHPDELSVGQERVREPLFKLQWLGLVESVDRMGIFAASLDVVHVCQASRSGSSWRVWPLGCVAALSGVPL